MKTFKFKDPHLEAEFQNLWKRFEKRVGKREIDTRSVSEAVGKEVRDGELEVLNRVLDGRTIATSLQAARSDDGYSVYGVKTSAGSHAFPAGYFYSDSDVTEVVKIEQGSVGAGLSVEAASGPDFPAIEIVSGGGGANLLEAYVTGEVDPARLTSGGQFMDASSEKIKELRDEPPAEWGMAVIEQLDFYRFTVTGGGLLTHMGPTAEAFHEETGLGDEHGIRSGDVAAVACLAIKSLNARISLLEQEVDRLRGRS